MPSYDVLDEDGEVVLDDVGDYDEAVGVAQKGSRRRVVRTSDRKVMRDFAKEADEIEVAMAELGFDTISTGGGCDAYYLRLPGGDPEDPPHVLVTEESNVPGAWDAQISVGQYPEGYSGDFEMEYFDTTRELVDAIRTGRSRLIPHIPGPSSPASSVTSADLETINRHRELLGMGPIDLDAGWTAEELGQMAESIRKTGTMANPARLKRKLLKV